MKKLLLLFGLLSFSITSFGGVVLCPVGAEGQSGCLRVSQVYWLGDWVHACCWNVDPPEGYECVSDDCAASVVQNPTNKPLSEAPVLKMPELTKQNAYVKFTEGYRTWIILDGEVNNHVFSRSLNSSTIREYLPLAQEIFKKNPEMEKFIFEHASNIDIVVQRPESEEDLEQIIVFPDLEREQKEFESRMKRRIEKSMTISPNPASDLIKVQFDYSISFVSMKITTTDGRTIQSMNFDEPVYNAEMPVSHLPSGIYLVVITDNKESIYSKQFLKK